jgi:hypothetical protein
MILDRTQAKKNPHPTKLANSVLNKTPHVDETTTQAPTTVDHDLNFAIILTWSQWSILSQCLLSIYDKSQGSITGNVC